MKRLLLAAAAVATLSIAGVSTAVLAADASAPASAADLAKAPRMGTWGFDLAGRDLTTKPGDDFFRYANGTYVDKLTIPADRSSWGASGQLRELSDARSRAIIETASKTPNATGEAQQIGGLYNSFMDEARLETLGARPLAGDLAKVKAASTHDQLAALQGTTQGRFGIGVFGVGIGPEAKDPTKYAVYVGQSGLGLPDRDYYLTEQFAAKKTAYRDYVAQMLTLAGWANPAANADAIVAFETKVAEASWTKVQQRDPVASVNPMTVADLQKLTPEFNWKAYLAAANLGAEQNIIVGEKSAFPKIAAIYKATPIETLQAWEAFHITDQASPYLSKAFADANFNFRSKTLSGQPEQRARWKRGVGLTGNTLGEAVGKLYVEAYFPAESKAKMEALVGNLLVAMKARIERLTWMSPETKQKALAKAASFTVKVGYPDEWRDYSKLVIRNDDLYGNIERAGAFNWDYQVGRLHKPVDKKEWGMFPQTVNAYYNPQLNEIVFPAAILQPPFFDPEADPAVNYGAIGAVIGHEISHGFDDQGSQFAADGSLTNWWQPADSEKFKAQTGALSALYSSFEPLPGAKVNGDLTLGENIGDLAGILIAYDAYHASLGGKEAPVIDGLTGDQRFFLAFGQAWRSKLRDDALRQQIASDPHSPAYYRVVGTLRNVDAWYAAFDVKPGDKMYVAPEKRVRIW
ncbi:MAG: M13-type metalloendopeptidase [Caulobacter sp.]|nr:M13-type metalloendopeptidase [Caulobacter sp.]